MKCWWIFFHKYGKWESIYCYATIIQQIKTCSKCNRVVKRSL